MTKLESLKTYVKLPIEDILERQADTIQKMYEDGGTLDELSKLETQYDSRLSYHISSQETVTNAKDVARGVPEVAEAREKLDEYQRKVKGGKATEKYLQNLYEWKKAQYKSEGDHIKNN